MKKLFFLYKVQIYELKVKVCEFFLAFSLKQAFSHFICVLILRICFDFSFVFFSL